MMHAEKYLGRVGAFEGAMYEARGYYRRKSTASCFPARTTSAKFVSERLRRSSDSMPAANCRVCC
jgi:hypothetical protein